MRRCTVCGLESTDTLHAKGHEWVVVEHTDPTCTEGGQTVRRCSLCAAEETESFPALGHMWEIMEQTEPTCTAEGTILRRCSVCAAEETEILPALGHQWETIQETKPTCTAEGEILRRCIICALEETEKLPPLPHAWTLVELQNASCTEDGFALRRCTVCGLEDRVTLPAPGHTYAWVTLEKTRDGGSEKEYRCLVCGEKAEGSAESAPQMLYNNTVTSFGPTTRELIGGNVWNRVTPLDLTQEGVFSYPLIASNRYAVGMVTVFLRGDTQRVVYKLNSSQIRVLSESLVFYAGLEDLKTGENTLTVPFDAEFNAVEFFGGDTKVLMGLVLKVDYDASGEGVQPFTVDDSQVAALMELVD